MRTAGRPTTALTLLAALGGAVGLGLLGLLSAPPAAAADPCVGVVVDARLLGGDVRTGCAEGDPDSGLEALTRAGFSYAFVPRQPGLVCQIDGSPECGRTTTTTYWSYWYRPKGSSAWVYAAEGAGSHDPPPGSTEAWVWQEGGRRQPPDIALRRICPQVAEPDRTQPSRSSSPSATRTAERTGTKAAAPRTSAKAAARASGPGPTTSAPSSGSASPTTTTTLTATPATTTPATTTPSTSPPMPTAARQDGDAGSSGGPWLGLAVGGGLVAALGGAAVARARRAGGTP